MPNKQIVSHLKEFRLRAGYTQEALAKKLGVTRQTINAIEQSKYQPTLYLAWQCANLFNTSIGKLFQFE
ncbi:MAG: helix-turn-helix transcriptional regulator [Candidatus Kerfeldbacteria bacterium]|nr:helix-turn-helix transcriptional regulator [Candidatus Kerfeldbacteria bacterium]